jgi:predicted protein tyrosine phosphatase
MPQIIISRASEVLKKVEEQKIAAVLSIEHPGAALDKGGSAPRLAENGHPEIPQKILVFWDSEQKVNGGPDISQVKEGLEFVMEHIGDGPVIIHCHAGKARSTALALGVLSLLHPDTDEKELLDMLLALRPQAAPNILVVEMVDKLTGRNGKLLQATLDHPVIAAQRAQAEQNRQDILQERPEFYERMYPEKGGPAAKKPAHPKPPAKHKR